MTRHLTCFCLKLITSTLLINQFKVIESGAELPGQRGVVAL